MGAGAISDGGSQRFDVAVLGGGIIGLSVAWRARQRGMSVAVLERGEIGGGASHVAAGMLAPVAEAEFGGAGRRLLELGLRAAQLWPAFARELGEAGGLDVGPLATGTLMVARDGDEARELERQLAFRSSLGLGVRRLRASQAREAEPGLAPTVRLALEIPDDHSVDPRAVLAALRAACASAGVVAREHVPVARVERDAAGAASGLLLDDGTRVAAAQVVLAAGAWSGAIAGLPPREAVPVRPVKGQILRLRDPAGPGLLRRILRYEGGYLVPRADGRYVLGATVEERGFELSATAGGVYELLREAHELVPGIAELEIEEVSAGLRPGTPDNTPVIGRARSVPGVVWACGHHRNGVLLAPLTAELVCALLAGEDADDGGSGDAQRLLATCSPLRFERAAPASVAGDADSGTPVALR